MTGPEESPIQLNLSQSVGIVVPTLGTRPEYLRECLSSIRAQSIKPKIYLVAPKDAWEKVGSWNEGQFDELVEDPGRGLASAINKGIAGMNSAIEFVSWLGDDDLLLPGALESSLQLLSARSSSVAAFGSIKMIDGAGNEIASLRARKSAVRSAQYWSNHIYQPGSLIRRESFQKINLLDDSLGWAFDLDMFLKLSKIGEVVFNPTTVAKFRWHSDSLSAGSSEGSIREASDVRRRHLASWLRPLAIAWEGPHVFLALWRAKQQKT